MTDKDGYKAGFTQPTRQILFMLIVLALVALGATVLGRQIQSVFYANVYLNGVIVGVFLFGVLATFWQVAQIIIATTWLKNLQAANKGHEFVKPPRILAAMAPMMRAGQLQQRMATSSTRSILDSIADRLDEMRDLTRYITSLLIFLGLLGTFWGLSITVPAVVDTIRSLAPEDGQTSTSQVFERLMSGLDEQLGGMGTAFASSLLGLAGSLVVGLLELFAGHGQNRFYRELEEWLSGFTRLGLISEGEGPEGGLMALLERIDEGLEMTTGFAKAAEEARIDSERRLGRAADVMTEMANQMEHERALIAKLVSEMSAAREAQSGRDHATLTVLKRIEAANETVASGQNALAQALERGGIGAGGRGGGESESRAHLQNVDMQLREIAHDLATGRRESTAALRAEIRALINLIDIRTKPPGSN
jgi:hypothetical protein